MKKVISLFLTALMMCLSFTPALAVELNENATNSTSAEVRYTTDSVWTVTIPDYIEPTEDGDELYSVAAQSVLIPDGKQLTVAVDYDGKLSNKDKANVELPYGIYKETSPLTRGVNDEASLVNRGDVILTVESGSPKTASIVSLSTRTLEKAKYAGIYTDTVIFNISLNEKVYTLEEINANEHLFAIGKTQPEYVVAVLNDDFTSVDIVKNGEDSDGLMKDWLSGPSNPGYDPPIFSNYPNLINANIKYEVTNVGRELFRDCEALTNVIIPDGVTDIRGNAFSGCSNLVNVNIPDGVVSIGVGAFNWCTSLTNITIPNSVTDLGATAFAQCQSLENVVISKNITEIKEGTFTGCKTLTSVTIPDKATTIGWSAFSGCSSLESVYIPNGITTIKYEAFYNCKSLKSVVIPDSVVSIETKTFMGCENLKEIILSKNITTIEDYTFRNCYALTNIAIPNGVTKIGNNAFDSCRALTGVTIPEGLKSIGNQAFASCSKLQSVTIPKSVTSIGNQAFSGALSFKIYGTAGSYAETWANNNYKTFVAI